MPTNNAVTTNGTQPLRGTTRAHAGLLSSWVFVCTMAAEQVLWTLLLGSPNVASTGTCKSRGRALADSDPLAGAYLAENNGMPHPVPPRFPSRHHRQIV